MVLAKIVMVGIAIVALMAVAQDQQWPQRAGVTGACVVTQPPTMHTNGTSYGSAWYVCKQGIMTGFPNLEADSCRSAGLVAHREVWSCIAPLESLPGY